MKKNESKYFYTAQLMNQALLSLIEKKDIEYITITEITKKAGVNRSTFYLHYETIYDLLDETIENLNKKFITSFNLQKPLDLRNKKNAFLITNNFLVPYLEFCKENKHVLKLIYSKPQLFNAKKIFQAMYNNIFYPAVSQFVEDEREKVYVLEFFTQGIVAIIHKWIALDCNMEINNLITLIYKCIDYQNN